MAKKLKSPWKDRKELLRDISSFIGRNGAFFKQNAKRMSDLFEMSIYNDAIRYYRRKKFNLEVKQLGKNGTFRYKLSPAGLKQNFSYFVVSKLVGRGSKRHEEKYEVHHNVRIQSAHDPHIYYTADVSVTTDNGVKTVRQNSGRKHSFIPNDRLITFFEVKNMNPFPEVLFSFSGLVLEVFPQLIGGQIPYGAGKGHLLPCIVFSGAGNAHAIYVGQALSQRWGFNVISGTYANKAQIYSFRNLNEYDVQSNGEGGS